MKKKNNTSPRSKQKTKIKKITIEEPVDKDLEEIEELDDEQDLDLVNVFSEFEGIEDSKPAFQIFKKNESGRNAFLTHAESPISVQDIANRFGGGNYMVVARDEKGKFIGKKTFAIDESWTKPGQGTGQDTEIEFLEKMKRYKELFGNESGALNKVVETVSAQMLQMSTMMSQQMMNNMSMLQQMQEQSSQSPGLAETIMQAIGMLSGKVLQLPSSKPKELKTNAKDKASQSK